MASTDETIVEKCKASWEEEFIAGLKNKNNCSGFVKAVAKKLGVPLTETANADQICDEISENWIKLDSGKDAALKAGTGTLVLGGLKSSEHTPGRNNGHVVIVVSGPLYREIYPKCWCGSTGAAQSTGDKSVGEVWSRADRDNVGYYAYTAV